MANPSSTPDTLRETAPVNHHRSKPQPSRGSFEPKSKDKQVSDLDPGANATRRARKRGDLTLENISEAAKTMHGALMSSKYAPIITPEEARIAAEVLESAFSPFSKTSFVTSEEINPVENALTSGLFPHAKIPQLTSKDIADAENAFSLGPPKIKQLKRAPLLYLTSRMGKLPGDAKVRRVKDLLPLVLQVYAESGSFDWRSESWNFDEFFQPAPTWQDQPTLPDYSSSRHFDKTFQAKPEDAKGNAPEHNLNNPPTFIPRHFDRDASKRRAIGATTLQEIQNDIAKIDLPSWLPRVPLDVGSAKCGKLNADQWRSLCTVNLVITLVRLWANHEKPRYHEMLDNFIDLVTAVKLGSRRILSPIIIKEYDKYMFRYVEVMLMLYPWVNMTPNQHIALHFGEHLKRFGPTQSSRTFATERENLRIRNIPTNQKFGTLAFNHPRHMFITAFYLRGNGVYHVQKLLSSAKT